MLTRSLFVFLLLPAILAAEKPWWERDPLRIIDIGTSLDRIDKIDPAELAARKAAQGYNAEHFEIMGMPAGLDDQHFYFSSQSAGRVNPDYLRRYLPEAKKRGIRVFIYFNVHWYTMQFAEQHPDWRQIREDGKPVDRVYDTGADFCVNTPWRKWCFQVLRDLAGYGVDGIFYDGPIYRAESCYCESCRQKFRAKYGRDLPSKRQRVGPDFARLIEFQTESLVDYLRESRQILKSINPEIALYMNGGVRGANWATARLNRALVKEQDLLGSEGGFISGDLTRTPMWKPGLTARLLETQAGGKPTVIFSAASHKPWTFSLLPSPELRLLYADSIANAASIWFGITPTEFLQPEMETLAGMNRYLAKNAAYYRNTKSEARMAIVWSDTTANFYSGADAQMIDVDRIPQRSEVGNLDGEFNGLSEALLRAHAPFDVIDDTAIEKEPLDRYQAIFLPNVACMSDATAARLREYVRNGGKVFATFETSLYDETGRRRPEFALADVLGVSDRRRIAGPTRWDFMKPVGPDPLLDGLKREWYPATTYHVRTAAKGAKRILQFTIPLKGRYDGVPGLSAAAALTVNSFGKGVGAYFSGDFGATVAQFRTPELLAIVENAVRTMAPPRVTLTNVPSSVEVVLRSQNQGKRWLVHLVNFQGEMTRPIRKVWPLRDVQVAVEGDAVRKAYTLMVPGNLAITRDAKGRSQVTVPSVGEYEVVVLER
ncbi:MAG: beta-galactosidase trimerization domain-containing protein [Bryobacteraceae bacterium]